MPDSLVSESFFQDSFRTFLPRDLQKRDLVSHFEVFFERKRRITNPKSSENSNNNFRGFERDAWRAFYRLQLASNRLVLIPWPSPRWCQILPRFFFYQAIERTKLFSGSFEEDYPAKWKRKEKTRRIFFSGVYTRRERAKKKESIFRSGIIRRGDVARCSTANNLRTKNCKKVEKYGLFLFFFPFFILFLQETKTRFVFREKRKIVVRVKLINGEGIEIFHEKRGFDCTRCNGLNALSKFISVSHFYVSFSRRKVCGLIWLPV